MMSLVQVEVQNSLCDAGISKEIIDKVKSDLENRIDSCRQPLDFLSSRYKIDNFFAHHPLSVCPVSVPFAARLESHGGRSSFVYDSFQYVSVKKTLHSLLQNKSYVEALLQDKCEPDVLSSFSDGSRCREHFLFGDCSKLSIKIQLFYDGLGVTNPLRGQSSLHNVGVFFYTVKNLPPQFISCFGNVHLLALCYSHDIIVYGYEPILDKFVAELKELSSVGLQGTFPLLGQCTVYASLLQVTCDNLALNGLFGFIESFSSSYFCTMCYATSDEIQRCFREEMFQRRTPQEYYKDLAGLVAAQKASKVHCRGIKRNCKLNDIAGFHVTENFSLDIMHIVMEGIVPVELGCILSGLCISDKCVSLDTVNREFQLLWGKVTVEQSHKPAEISKIVEPGHVLVPSMKAIQYMALLKYLPLAIGKYVPYTNVHWKFLLHLSHLVDMIFAPRFTLDTVAYLKNVISDHLSWFVNLYSSEHVKLRPKHHFLVHLPSIVLKSGPLTGMSCMRYELKNSFFKRCAHIVSNFTNICYTLAYRHQQYALYSQLTNNHIRSVMTVGRHNYELVDRLAYRECLQQQFAVESSDEIAVCRKLCVSTVQYKHGHYLLLSIDTDTGEPNFGRILEFVSLIGDDTWYVVVEGVQTAGFVRHLHAYEVSLTKPPVFAVCLLQALADYHPLYCHSLCVGCIKKELVRLPYHLF